MDIYAVVNEHEKITNDPKFADSRAGMDSLLAALVDATHRHFLEDDYIATWTKMDSGDLGVAFYYINPGDNEVTEVVVAADGRRSDIYNDDEKANLIHPYEMYLAETGLPVWDGPADLDLEVEAVMANRHILTFGSTDPKQFAEYVIAAVALHSEIMDMIDHEYPPHTECLNNFCIVSNTYDTTCPHHFIDAQFPPPGK